MLVFGERGKPEYPEKNLSEQRREPTTNSTHIWRRRRDLNPRHTGGRRVLSPLGHPLFPKYIITNWQLEILVEAPNRFRATSTLTNIDPFKLFLTFDIEQLAKNQLTPLKKRLNNSRSATFESYLLKKDEHITVQLGRFNNVRALFSTVWTN